MLDRYLAACDPALALEARVRSAWPGVAGETVARRARPLRIEGTTLWIEVASHAWAQELSFLREDLMARLCERVGEGAITEIRFQVAAAFPAPSSTPAR